MTIISYRFTCDPSGRPDQTEYTDKPVQTRAAMAGWVGPDGSRIIITGQRAVSWQEQLAAMESPEL